VACHPRGTVVRGNKGIPGDPRVVQCSNSMYSDNSRTIQVLCPREKPPVIVKRRFWEEEVRLGMHMVLFENRGPSCEL
jgi:hypothetical protein